MTGHRPITETRRILPPGTAGRCWTINCLQRAYRPLHQQVSQQRQDTRLILTKTTALRILLPRHRKNHITRLVRLFFLFFAQQDEEGVCMCGKMVRLSFRISLSLSTVLYSLFLVFYFYPYITYIHYSFLICICFPASLPFRFSLYYVHFLLLLCC